VAALLQAPVLLRALPRRAAPLRLAVQLEPELAQEEPAPAPAVADRLRRREREW